MNNTIKTKRKRNETRTNYKVGIKVKKTEEEMMYMLSFMLIPPLSQLLPLPFSV